MNARILLQRLVGPLVLTLGGIATAQAPTAAQRVLLAQAELIGAITTPDQPQLVRAWLDAVLDLMLGREPDAATSLGPAAQTLVTPEKMATAKAELQASVWRDLAGLLAIGSGHDDREVISLRRLSLEANSTTPQHRLALRLLREVREGTAARRETQPKAEGIETWRQQQDDQLARVLESPETSLTLRQRTFDHLAGEFRRQAEVDGDPPEQRIERLERLAKAAQQLLPELNHANLAGEPGPKQWPFTTLCVRLKDAHGDADGPRPVDSIPTAPTTEIRRRLGGRWVPLTTWPGPAVTTPTTPYTQPATASLRMIAERDAIYWLRATSHLGTVDVLLTWLSDTATPRLGSGSILLQLPAQAPARQVLVAEMRADGSYRLTQAACSPFWIQRLKRATADEPDDRNLHDALGTVAERSQDICAAAAGLLLPWLKPARSVTLGLNLPTPTVGAVLTACAGTEPFDLQLGDELRLLDRATVADETKRYLLIHTTEVSQ